jgi:GT2 family glycosyltransferase
VEVIVVDNASTDGSASWLAQAHPEVRLTCTSENRGYGAGGNLGTRLARGRYLAFLNPDTTVEPGWLEALLAALEADPQAGLVTSRILLMEDPEHINTCGNDVHISGLTLCRGMGQPRDAFPHLEEVSAVSGAAFAIRKDLFESLGGFDERFFMYMEDTDLSLRARLAGYRCLYAPDSVAYHAYTLRFGPLKTYYQERNRYAMLLKCLRWRTLLTLLPALLLAEMVTWGFVLLRQRRNLGNKLRAYAWLLGHWPEVMQSRRRAQTDRRAGDRILLEATRHALAFEQAGAGPLARAAHALFDPLFAACKALAMVWQ